MPRRQFEQVVAQASRIRVKELPFTISGTVPVGSSDVIDIYSTPGTKSKVIGMYIQCLKPPGAASGTHYFKTYNASPVVGSKPEYFLCAQQYSGDILLNRLGFLTYDNSISYPKTEEGQLMALQSQMYDDVKALRIFYYNNTNVVQTQARTIFLLVEEMEIR